MFGYITADKNSLSPQQLERYRGCYCGLCKAIGRRSGSLARFALTYDMTFLILLLNSLYEPEESSGSERCPVHPLKTDPWWSSPVTDYAADMNIALAWLSLIDDWKDEKKPVSLLEAALLRKGKERVAADYEEKWKEIQISMDRLEEAERNRLSSPDEGAKAFGHIMGELFLYKRDRWEPVLRAIGHYLGSFIYILDAFEDLEKDEKRGLYNPLSAMKDEGAQKEDFIKILTMFMADCTTEFEKLPLVKDIDIMRNILYNGVWSRFTREPDKS